MSQTLLIALVLSLPFAALAFAAAFAVDALGAGLRLRLAAWRLALIAPLVLAPLMLAVQTLDVHSPLALAAPAAIITAGAPVVMGSEVLAAPVSLPTEAVAPPVAPSHDLSLVALALLAVAGVAGLRLVGLAAALSRVARLKAGSQPLTMNLARRLGPGVRLAETLTPVLAGVLRPAILMPRTLLDQLSEDEAALVCAHERAHLAHGDHVAHLAEEVALRLYWFNPLLKIIRDRLAAAREEACDAEALTARDGTARRAYARTLLNALSLAGEAQPVAAFTGFSHRQARRRLEAILKPPGRGAWKAAVVAVLAALGLTAGVACTSLALAAEPLALQAVQPPVSAAQTPTAQAPVAAPAVKAPATRRRSSTTDAAPAPADPPAPPAPPAAREPQYRLNSPLTADQRAAMQRDRDQIREASRDLALQAAAQARAQTPSKEAMADFKAKMDAYRGQMDQYRAQMQEMQKQITADVNRQVGSLLKPDAEGRTLMHCNSDLKDGRTECDTMNGNQMTRCTFRADGSSEGCSTMGPQQIQRCRLNADGTAADCQAAAMPKINIRPPTPPRPPLPPIPPVPHIYPVPPPPPPRS